MKRKVEIEGKEAVQLPNGQSYMAEGPSHENGGIPIELPVGSRVYSKRVKKDGKSMAERKAKRDRDLKSMVNTVMDNPFDGPSEAAMRRMMTAYAQQEAADMDTMERAQMKKEATQSMESNLPDDAFSSPDQMKCGGKVKKYKNGGSVDPTPKRPTTSNPVTGRATAGRSSNPPPPSGRQIGSIDPTLQNTYTASLPFRDRMTERQYQDFLVEQMRSNYGGIDAPQQTMMEFTTGRRESPSDALRRHGVKNPYVLSAADIIIDPMNLFGGLGVGAKINKLEQLMGAALKAANVADSFSDTRETFNRGATGSYKQGGIVIDPEKKGTFKAQATRMGMSVGQAANYILDNPDEFSPKMRKKANFAKNFAMAYGGMIMDELANGGMIKRADGSYSKRGLWDNIRDNIGSGKEPTPEMLEQERKLKEMMYGGKLMYGGKMYAEGGEVEEMEIEDVINAMIDVKLNERLGQGDMEGEEMEEEGEEMEEESDMEEEEMGYGGKLKKMRYGGKVKTMMYGGKMYENGGKVDPKVTHQMAIESPDGENWFAFPMVDYDTENKTWIKFDDPWEAYDYHQEKGTLLKLPSEEMAMYYGQEGLISHGGKKDPKLDAMAQKINKENSYIPWVDRGLNPEKYPALRESEFVRMKSERPVKQKMADGGTVKNGTTKRSTRKGKKMMVYMDGSWHHFGDSSMDDFRTHKSEKRKKAFYDRHKKNLQGDSPRAKAFRVYARKTWENGGTIPMYQGGTSGIPPQDRFNTAQFMTEPAYMEGDMQGYMGPFEQTPLPIGSGVSPLSATIGTPVFNPDVTATMNAPARLPSAPTSVRSMTAPDPLAGLNTPPPAPDTRNPSGLLSRTGTKVGNAIGAASQFIGSNMGPLGIAVGALGPLAATIINRIGDKTNESFYEDYGREGLAANAASMRGVEASRQMGMEDIARQQAGSVAQTRGMGSVNAARGVQQMAGAQAMRASTVANQQATTQQAGLMGQRANLLNARDAQVMQARQAADQANVEDRDAFFTALSSNLSNLGTGMMYAARNRKPAKTAAQAINAKVLG